MNRATRTTLLTGLALAALATAAAVVFALVLSRPDKPEPRRIPMIFQMSPGLGCIGCIPEPAEPAAPVAAPPHVELRGDPSGADLCEWEEPYAVHGLPATTPDGALIVSAVVDAEPFAPNLTIEVRRVDDGALQRRIELLPADFDGSCIELIVESNARRDAANTLLQQLFAPPSV